MNEERIPAAIAEQAGEWFAANDEEPLDALDSAALAAWLKISPVYIEEFLGCRADAFIAFLRSLKGVRVEVTAAQILVSRD